jgi:DNA-binding MarR family transcriptional regulator
MEDFRILEGGRLGDANVLRMLDRLRADVPNLDEAAIEAHLMFFRAYGAFYASLGARYEDLGVSISRFKMLLWLYNSGDQERTISELGAVMEASVPNVVRMVQSLEALDWVERIQKPTDKRVTMVRLTPEGLLRFRALLPRALDIWEEVWSGLSDDEMSMLTHLLARLRLSLNSRYIGGQSLVPFKIETRKRRRRQHSDYAEPDATD